jgi:hypothetical protein
MQKRGKREGSEAKKELGKDMEGKKSVERDHLVMPTS